MGGKPDVPEETKQLANIANQYFKMSKEPLGTALNTLQSLLTTGGVGAREPIYGKAVESSGRAASQARTKTEEDLSRTGLAGTPFGMETLANFDLDTALNLAQLPIQMQDQDFWNFMQLLLPLLTGTTSQVTHGLSSAGQQATAIEAAKPTGLDVFTGITSGISQLNPFSITKKI